MANTGDVEGIVGMNASNRSRSFCQTPSASANRSRGVRALVMVAAAGLCASASAGVSSVVAGDTAAVAMRMFSSEGDQYINSLGNVSVKRGQAPVSIGENTTQQTFGGGTTKPQIMASWDEFVGTSTSTIVLNVFTSDGAPFLPMGYSIAGQTFDFWTWNFGMGDKVTWRGGAPAAPLIQARFQLSSTGGDDFQTNKSMTTNLGNPWAGSDFGITQADLAASVNFVRISYEVSPIPAPSAAALLGLSGLAAVRRRRR